MLAGQVAATGSSIADGDVLAALLAAEGLLFAALAIAFDRLRPDGKLQLFLVPPAVLGYLSAGANITIAAGALVPWHSLFVVDGWTVWPDVLVVVSVLVAIVSPPVLSVLLASGLRKNRK